MTADPPGDDNDEARRELERWRYALENAEDGLWDWSATTGRVYRSPRSLSMLGYDADGILESIEAWHALVHPDDQAGQQQAIADHLRCGSENYKVEYRLRDARGSWRWILDRGKVIQWSADGRPVRVVGTHTDISGYKELEERLREREHLLAEAQRIGHIGSWALDIGTNQVWWSPEMFRIAGWPDNQTAPSWEQQRELYLPESYARLSEAVVRALRDGVGYAMDVELQRPDGDRRSLEVIAEVIRDDVGSIERLVGVVHDVTDERLTTAAARWRNKLLDRIASVGRIGGFDLDVNTGTVQWTDENYRIHGMDPATPVVLEELLERYDEPSRRRLLEALKRLDIGSSREETAEAQYVTPDGRRLVLRITANIEDEPGSRRRITGLTQDITEEREAGERIEQLAHFDMLTGLPNRFLFRQRAVEAIRVAQRAKLSLGLLFVDLDRFKYVNDTLGHAVGDLLLQEVSGRLKACLRGSDLIGRQGGDEFMVMLCEMRKPEDAAIVAEKIIAAVGVPITLGEVEVQVGCSIGIALLSDNNPDMESLMRASDTAMYAAKDAGRNTFQYYNDSFYERVHRRGLLEQELRQAVARKELFLVYQPTVSLSGNGEVVGIEALLRWQRTDGELRSPMEFIPIAEDTGEIVPIGLWVLEEACRQACAWDAAGVRFSSIAVNVSAVQLRDPDFASRVLAICARTGWPPTRLVLELTESALMRDTDVLRRTFAVFEEKGINLSVDDFGTGFSNLLYLHRFPIQQLKIDRSFVSQMLEDLQVGVLTQAIINLGHAMGLTVIAEGVETEVSLRALRNQGCDEAQGYHMTRPLLPADMAAWIAARGAAAD
ncbi:MAG: EAL domain-containing protein [Gammaproteobacteria bacterium]|nr:EAL domain-containing protein [Gammaproteobacteria bacterium]